jgi:hypothetical protein
VHVHVPYHLLYLVITVVVVHAAPRHATSSHTVHYFLSLNDVIIMSSFMSSTFAIATMIVVVAAVCITNKTSNSSHRARIYINFSQQQQQQQQQHFYCICSRIYIWVEYVRIHLFWDILENRTWNKKGNTTYTLPFFRKLQRITAYMPLVLYYICSRLYLGWVYRWEPIHSKIF